MFTAPAISPEAATSAARVEAAGKFGREYPELPQTVFAMLAEGFKDAEIENMILNSDPDRDVIWLTAIEAELDARNEDDAAFAAQIAQVPAESADHGIEEWWMRPVAKPVAGVAVEDAGIYVLPDGSVVKVQANREKTRTYGKVWTPSKNRDRLMEDDHHEAGEYVYQPGIVEVVAATGRRMTLEEAKVWSVRIGACIRCGRKLVNGKSVEAGLGPVCIRWFQGA